MCTVHLKLSCMQPRVVLCIFPIGNSFPFYLLWWVLERKGTGYPQAKGKSHPNQSERKGASRIKLCSYSFHYLHPPHPLPPNPPRQRPRHTHDNLALTKAPEINPHPNQIIQPRIRPLIQQQRSQRTQRIHHQSRFYTLVHRR